SSATTRPDSSISSMSRWTGRSPCSTTRWSPAWGSSAPRAPGSKPRGPCGTWNPKCYCSSEGRAMARKGVGALRRGQVVTSFGPGATIDLPDLSVIIGGLEWWRGYDRERVLEPRLEAKVAEVLGVPRIALFAPPAELKEPGAPLVGIQ